MEGRPSLLSTLHRLRDANARRQASERQSPEFDAATRELDELTARIWGLQPRRSDEHDFALAVARLDAVKASLAESKLSTDLSLRMAHQTIEQAHDLLRRVRDDPPESPE